jgi:hypothetical protein
MKDVIKVDVATTNKHDGALVEVSAKARDLSKAFKDGGEVLYVVLGGRKEDCRIVGVKIGPQNDSPPSNLMKQTMSRCELKELGNGVDSEEKK